jgi:hypothetical protein
MAVEKMTKISTLTFGTNLVHLLVEHEHVVGSKLLYSLQKTYCINHRHLHMTQSLPHNMHYKELLLI